MRQLVLIAHNLRSAHNVGSLFRTADGLAVAKLWLTGYTPYPQAKDDKRLPHLAARVHRQITKTSLGSEAMLDWQHSEDVAAVVGQLKQKGYRVVGLEQAGTAVKLPDFNPPDKLALIVGREVQGLEAAVLRLCDEIVEIPMLGKKESHNVCQAAAMALYHCRFTP